MRTTLELLELCKDNLYNIYKLSDEEVESIIGLTYKQVSVSPRYFAPTKITYSMPIKVTEDASYYLYNKIYNILSLSYITFNNEEPWLNLTVHSIDDSMFRGIIYNAVGINIDSIWIKVYSYFKNNSPVSKEQFIEFCTYQLNITEFDWN